jgi:hypothetical protein
VIDRFCPIELMAPEHRVFWSSYGPDWGFGTYAEKGELCSRACELERCFEGEDCALDQPPDDWCRDGE